MTYLQSKSRASFRFVFESFLLVSVLAGCSLYQSPGRKYLEQNSYQFAGVAAQPNLLECGDRPIEDGWNVLSDESGAQTLARADFALRVRPKSAAEQTPDLYACDFQFESEAELADKKGAAVELTTAMHDSTGR